MALSNHNTTTDSDGNPPRNTLKGYLVRYRLALYLFSGAVVVSGVILSWNWLTAAGLLPGISSLHVDDVHVHEAWHS